MCSTLIHPRILQQQWQSSLLDLGWLLELHSVNSLEEVLVAILGLMGGVALR